jgi:alpha-1,2-mannosyltransferase
MAQGRLRRTGLQILAVLLLAAVVAVFLDRAAARHGFFDLQIYYGSLRHWLDGGHLYDWLKPGTKYGFTYPPFAALVMLPMAYLPWWPVMVISVTLSVLAGALVIWWLLDPVARRAGWSRWFAFAVVACLAAAFEPLRETVNFGQVNLLLLALVAADLLLLVAPYPVAGGRWATRWRRFAGVGIGLATAIKLTPGIFIMYLLVTGRWRAMFTAIGTAVVATLLAAAVAPDTSREFWTAALWDTDRVGTLAFISNQSWQGMVARLNPAEPDKLAWALLVAATLIFWAWRCRRAVAVGDEATGFALTGVVGCLVSPVTWVHHLVWLLPALLLLVDSALAAPAGSRRRRGLLCFAIGGYLLLISRLVWHWEHDFTGFDGFLGSNAYVWISAALLLGLPIRDRAQFAEVAPRRPGSRRSPR